MTKIAATIFALNEAKARALTNYSHNPDGENHVSYQMLHELALVFKGMISHAEKIENFADKIFIPYELLESWMIGIAHNCLYRDDSYLTTERAIKEASLKVLTPKEIARAERERWNVVTCGNFIVADDALMPFLKEPSEDTLEALNEWILQVGKSTYLLPSIPKPTLFLLRRS